MDAFQAFLETAPYNQSQSDRFMYHEQFRHGPNVAGMIWNWIDAHYWQYLAFLAVAVLIAITAFDGTTTGRFLFGSFVGLLLVAPACAAFVLFQEPAWHAPTPLSRPELARILERVSTGPALLSDPNLICECQVFKYPGDPDDLELAHVLWLSSVNLAGQRVRRAVSLWSSLDQIPVSEDAIPVS